MILLQGDLSLTTATIRVLLHQQQVFWFISLNYSYRRSRQRALGTAQDAIGQTITPLSDTQEGQSRHDYFLLIFHSQQIVLMHRLICRRSTRGSHICKDVDIR